MFWTVASITGIQSPVHHGMARPQVADSCVYIE
jgi:hypothetical protein